MRIKIGFAIAMMLILLTSTVYAHDDANTVSGLSHSIQHVLMSLDHLLVVLGVGLFAGLLGKRAALRRDSS